MNIRPLCFSRFSTKHQTRPNCKIEKAGLIPFTQNTGMEDIEIMIFLFTTVFGGPLEIVIMGIMLCKSTRMYLEK